MRALIGIAALVIGSSACAAPEPASIPQNHLSVAGEAQAARQHERAGGVLERQAALESSQTECGHASGSGVAQICWTGQRIPGSSTADMLAAADERKAAAEHRRVSAALRDAERISCAGIAEEDIIRSPFAHTADIVDVQEIQAMGRPGPAGASVRFHEIEHLSADMLQHVIDCQLARDNAMGHDVPEMSYCPLVPRGATATVRAVPHGYVVDVVSDDPAAAREILRRSRALLP